MKNLTPRTALALSLIAHAAAAQKGQSVSQSYTIEKIGRGLFAFIAPETFGSLVSGNSLVVIGDSAVLVVDAGHFPSLTRRMIAAIRSTTSKPVRYLVNTHWHPDHWLGNGDYRAAFPDVEIIATPFTRDEIRTQGPAYLKAYADSAAMTRQLSRVLGKDGSANAPAIDPAARAYYEATIADAAPAYAAWHSATLELPNVLVDKHLTVDLGNRTVEIMFLGRGNTSGDLAVFVPDERVLATGDLVVSPTPYAFGSYFSEWTGVLDSLAAVKPSIIVPGHGIIQHDTSYLMRLRSLISTVRDRAHEAVKAGKSFEDFRKGIDLSRFEREFAGDDPRRRFLFVQGFTTPGLRRAYDEAAFQVER